MSETRQPLTPNDPVSPDALRKFEELDSARYELASRLLDLEQERVRILAAAHQVDTQKTRLFEQVLVERGLQPNTSVTINDKGEIKVVEPVKP